MSEPTYAVRELQASDTLPDILSQSANLLAEVFETYPWTRWTVDPSDLRERLRALYQLTLTELVAPYGRLWVATTRSTLLRGDGDEQVIGVAGWLPPDLDAPPDTMARVAEQTTRLRGARATVAAAADAAVGPHALTSPHWYLGTIGVARSARGRGIGGALLAAGTALADRSRHPVRLETSSARNVLLYERHGFEIVAHVALPDGAPPCWVMQRDPGPGDATRSSWVR